MNRFLSAIIGHISDKPDAIFSRFIKGDTVQEIRWRDLDAGAEAFLSAYRAVELPRGELILIFLRRAPELYASFLGAMLGGFRPSFMPCTSPKQDPRLYWSSHAKLFDRIDQRPWLPTGPLWPRCAQTASTCSRPKSSPSKM